MTDDLVQIFSKQMIVTKNKMFNNIFGQNLISIIKSSITKTGDSEQQYASNTSDTSDTSSCLSDTICRRLKALDISPHFTQLKIFISVNYFDPTFNFVNKTVFWQDNSLNF